MVNCSSSFSPFSSSSFFFLFFSVSLQVILFLTLLAAELKKTNNKPKRPSVKTLFGNITSWLFIFFLQHSLYIVVISCSIYRHFLVYYTFCSKVQTPIKFDLLWGWCEMGYWHLYHKASYNPNPHVYLTGIYLLLIFFFFPNLEFLCAESESETSESSDTPASDQPSQGSFTSLAPNQLDRSFSRAEWIRLSQKLFLNII